jgi:hypothetical protein
MRYLRYASLAVSLAASALVAIVAVSMLPQYWTSTSLVAGAVTVSWACLSAARTKRRLPAPTRPRSLKRHELQRDAFGNPV